MRHSVLLAALAAVSPALAQEPAAPGEDLFPLTVGNTWTYKVSGQDERFIVRAVRQEMVGSQTCVLVEASLKDKVVATEHLAFTKAGLCRFRVDKEDVTPPVCILKLPATRRATWTESGFRVGDRSASATFSADQGAPVTVPAGRYRGVIVHADIGGGDNGWRVRTTSWYSRGVGPVKQVVEEGKRTLVLELEKFEKGDEK